MASPALGNKPEVQSMLVIHQGALGDFILTLPALATLRSAFPQAKPVIMGYPRILELVEQRYYAEQIFSIDQRGMASFYIQEGPLDQGLSKFFSAFDFVIVFGKDEEGIFTENLRRVCQREFLHINTFPSWDERVHLTDCFLNQLTRYGIPVSESNSRLHLKQSDRDWGRDFWRRRGLTEKERAGLIILHPGSGSKRKVWKLERFLSLVHTIQNDLNSRVLIVLGPAEGTEVQKAFEEMKPNAPLCVRGLSLIQLASVMEGCRLFIGNDSGISHLAAALELPTIAIFGPTDPNVWSPRGKKVLVIRKELPCSPCSQERFFQCKDFACLNGIEVGEALRGLESMGIGVYV
jgi:ADP-heptose:LPS heptosyltransferase